MLTGGRDDRSEPFLNTAIFYPEGCSVPSMELNNYAHVSFLTQDKPPRVAVCGGLSDSAGCLVLQQGHWREGILDWPGLRFQAATARLDAGVYILGGSTEHKGQPSFSSLFLRANSNSWVSGPRLRVSMKHGPCAAPISAHSFLLVYKFDV